MIMMMTDPDRVALSAFLPAFLFRFIHPFMPTSTPTFHRNVHPAICHTSYYPVRSSSSVSHRSKFVSLLPISRQHLGVHARPPHYFSRLLPLVFAQHLSAGLLPFLPLLQPSSQQPPTSKKLAESHPALLPSFFASQHAYTHLRSIIYVSITRGGIYLAPKRRIC